MDRDWDTHIDSLQVFNRNRLIKGKIQQEILYIKVKSYQSFKMMIDKQKISYSTQEMVSCKSF